MNPLILCMSFCGSVVFGCYLLFAPIAKHHFKIEWRYSILKLSLVFFLVPLPKMKFFLLEQMFRVFPDARTGHVERLWQIDMGKHVFVAETDLWMFWKLRFLLLALMAAGTVTITVICIRLFRYRRMKRLFFHSSSVSDSKDWNETLSAASRKLNIKKKIPLFFSMYADSPVTVGVFAPRIILPSYMKTGMNKTEQRYVVTHELNHIKSRDLAVRFLAVLAVAVHWFNPLCHLLLWEVCSVSEIQCDFRTLRDTENSRREEYSYLIVGLAEEVTRMRSDHWAAHFTDHNSMSIERRILEMKMNHGKRKIILSYVLGGLIGAAGCMPVFAYAPPMVYETTIKAEDLDVLAYSGLVYYDNFDMTPFVVPMPCEYFWQGEDGTVVPLDDGAQPEARKGCAHQYQSGTTSRHTKYRDNSCEIVIKECKLCSLCGHKVEGTTINTITYAVCPH